MKEADLVDGQDVRLERGNGLTVEQPAFDAIFRQKGLLLLRGANGVAAPGLQPAGLADALCRIRFHDPLPMQYQRYADQPVQRSRPWFDARRCRVRWEADDPVDIPKSPGGIPAQRRVPVGQVSRQCAPK